MQKQKANEPSLRFLDAEIRMDMPIQENQKYNLTLGFDLEIPEIKKNNAVCKAEDGCSTEGKQKRCCYRSFSLSKESVVREFQRVKY